MSRPTLAIRAADAVARIALRVPSLERALVVGLRQPALRRHLRLGAIAHGYSRVLRRREIRIAEMEGYRFYVNVGESLGIEPYFFRQPGTLWFTREIVRPGDVCIDAGANAGHYTFHCASIVSPGGRVFAFEPNPDFAELLRRSVRLNDYGRTVQIEQRALYARSGEVLPFLLSVEPTNTGTSSLVDHGWYVSPDRAIDVSTVTLDDFARGAGVDHLRLVKIDVERAEEFVLAGAERLIGERRIDYMIVEMHARSPAHDILDRTGYEGYLAVAEERRLVPAAEVPPDQFGDYLYVRPGLSLPRG
jgi:FkbM family methyltransferase